MFLKLAEQQYADLSILPQVDEALARWKIAPAYEYWLTRMRSTDRPWPAQRSAMIALGIAGVKAAADDLRRKVEDNARPDHERIIAAQALARIDTTGLVLVSQTLAGRGTIINRLLASELLQHHTQADALTFLQKLAMDDEPAVAQLAVDRLLALAPANIPHDLASRLLQRDDAALRLTAVKALLAQATSQSIALASPSLKDVNYTVRRTAREGLGRLGLEGGLHEPVVSGVRGVLHQSDWQGLEQAAYLVGALDDEASSDRVVELLRHARPEVRLAACVALRRLQMTDTLPIALKRLEELHEHYKNTGMETYGDLGEFSTQFATGAECTQLYQLLGRMKYAPAQPIMRRVVPKGSFEVQSRAAAIWALGFLHEGQADGQLAGQLSGRLSDVMSLEPEDTNVRMMSAVTLGRMKAQSALSVLNRFMQEEISSREIGGSCRWAIMQITGEELPPLPPSIERNLDWFLAPIE
ncbi:MAG: hypothetical protein HC898_04645 [Phycisphaerales bacterium]|nr:hypothetical protein [Phycisphaerales bacterium]